MTDQKRTQQYLSIAVALLTFFGIALHDTKLDVMTKFAIALPAVIATYEGAQLLHVFGGDSHTHVERVAVRDVLSRYNALSPRSSKDKKYRLNNRVQKGHHAFDNYNLPVVA